MLTVLFLLVIAIGMVLELFKKYVLKVKDPTIEELMVKLEEQDWFIDLCKHKEYKEIIGSSKRKGLLTDPYYVQKLLEHQGTVDGFITYIKNRAK